MKWTDPKESGLLTGPMARGDSAPSRLVMIAEDQRVILDLAGLDVRSEAPPDLPIPTLRAAVEDGSIFVDLGASPGCDRRLLAALACGARAIVADDRPFARALARWGAPIQFSGDDPAALRAALLLAEEGEAQLSASRQRELELADAWIEDTDAGEERSFRLGPVANEVAEVEGAKGRGPDLLFTLDLDPDDRRHCERIFEALASCSLAIVGTRREPASTGESEFEARLIDEGFGFQRRVLIGAGRRLDLIVRRSPETTHD